MTESTVWRVMHPDGSRTVVGHYPQYQRVVLLAD